MAGSHIVQGHWWTDPAVVLPRMKLPVGQTSDRQLLFNNPLSLLAQLFHPFVITTHPEYLCQASQN